MGFSIKNEWEEEVNRCMQMRVGRVRGGGSGERGGRGGQEDECSSPDKGVCIPLLSEKQREGGRERIKEVGQLIDEDSDFWKMVFHM